MWQSCNFRFNAFVRRDSLSEEGGAVPGINCSLISLHLNAYSGSPSKVLRPAQMPMPTGSVNRHLMNDSVLAVGRHENWSFVVGANSRRVFLMNDKEKDRKDYWRQVRIAVIAGLIVASVTVFALTPAGAMISQLIARSSSDNRPSKETGADTNTSPPEVIVEPATSSASTSPPSVGTRTSGASSSPSTEFLSKLTPPNKMSETGWEIDKSYNIDGVLYNNSIYDKCYVATCRNRPDFIEFDLGKRYKKLTATIGIYQQAKDIDQPAVLTIYLDGKAYGESYILKGGNGDSQNIEIPVENVMRIRLELAGTDINYKDYENKAFEVIIGNPVLYK